MSSPPSNVSLSMLDDEVHSVLQTYGLLNDKRHADPLQSLVVIFTEGSGRGLCKRIIAVIKAANTLGYSFYEAFDKQPIELLQLFSLKAQEAFVEAKLLVQTHPMLAASIAQILAESFLRAELLILSHHFYKSSVCLDGVDLLMAPAATRVHAYVLECDFPCLACLITGVGNFHALNFILDILIENGQLDLLLQKYSAAADTERK